jgi:AAA ATPase domain
VEGVVRGASAQHLVDTAESLVGRDAEIARISSFLDDVPTGAAALLIAGEAGIGKTTVWGEGLRIAAERSVRLLVTRPSESDIKFRSADSTTFFGRHCRTSCLISRALNSRPSARHCSLRNLERRRQMFGVFR